MKLHYKSWKQYRSNLRVYPSRLRIKYYDGVSEINLNKKPLHILWFRKDYTRYMTSVMCCNALVCTLISTVFVSYSEILVFCTRLKLNAYPACQQRRKKTRFRWLFYRMNHEYSYCINFLIFFLICKIGCRFEIMLRDVNFWTIATRKHVFKYVLI